MKFSNIILSGLLITLSFQVQAQQTQKIGFLLELTGNTAMSGQACKNGAELGYETFYKENPSTRPVKILYGDHRAEAKTAISEFRRMVTMEKVAAMISTRSQATMALNPLSQKSQIPLLGIVGHSEFVSGNDYSFRVYPSTEVEGPTLASKTRELGLKRAAIITLQDEWTESLATNFSEAFTSKQGQVVFSESVPPDDQDFLPILSSVRSSNPDVIFANVNGATLGMLLRKIREQGFKQQLISNFWSTYPWVIEVAGANAINGLRYVAVNLDKPKFREKYISTYAEKNLNAISYCCYAGMVFALQAAKFKEDSQGTLYQALLDQKKIALADESLEVVNREIKFDVAVKALP